MKRIGIAASRIAKGNLWVYHLSVLFLSSLFSFLVFVLSAFSLLVGFGLLSFISKAFVIFEAGRGFSPAFLVAMAALAVVVGIMNLVAIIMNIRIR